MQSNKLNIEDTLDSNNTVLLHQEDKKTATISIPGLTSSRINSPKDMRKIHIINIEEETVQIISNIKMQRMLKKAKLVAMTGNTQLKKMT